MFVRRNIFGILLLVFLGACSKEPPREAYFGGMIKNPVDKYVLLYRHYIPAGHIDTFLLDAQGRFGHKIKLDSADMYFFLHGDQTNLCYLRPGDSLLVYSNMMSFDNSMQFSGMGAGFNNLILRISLISANEIDMLTNLIYRSDKEMLLSYINQYDLSKQNEIQKYLARLPDDYMFTTKEEEVLNYSVYFPDFYLLEGYNTVHADDSVAYSFPFHFSLNDSYHPVHYFLAAYLYAYMYHRLHLPDSLTPTDCLKIARKVDKMINDTVNREFVKFQLITNQLSTQKQPPSPKQFRDILTVFPRVFHYSEDFSREFINLYNLYPHTGRLEMDSIN